MSLTADQIQQLLAALPGMIGGRSADHSLGAVSTVGPMGQCNLGIDKTDRLMRSVMIGENVRGPHNRQTKDQPSSQLGRARAVQLLRDNTRMTSPGIENSWMKSKMILRRRKLLKATLSLEGLYLKIISS